MHFKDVESLTSATQLVLAKRGYGKRPKIPDVMVGDEIRDIRKLASVERASKMSVANAKAKQGAQKQVVTRVAGNAQGPPADYLELDYAPLGAELREADRYPRGGWAEVLPQGATGPKP